MDPTERVVTVLRGEIPDRVPVFCAGIEDRTFNEVLGQPRLQNSTLFRNRVVRWLLDRMGTRATRLVQRVVTKGMRKRIAAQAQLGFDCLWGLYDRTFIARDAQTMWRYTGSLFQIIEDGYGNMSYFYREPAIHSREEYETWPYWPDPEDLARRTYKFYKPLVEKYGDTACIFGQGPLYGIFESLMWTLGLGQLSYWVRSKRDLVEDYVARCEAIAHASMMAMMDAGIRVVLQTDDMAFKTGPLMAPKQLDEIFGPAYTRLTQAVHERGGYYVQHSCGDNTDLFEYFVKWGFDGVHALENTSSVDVAAVKRRWGDEITLVGGVGIDYLLSERSTDGEVRAAVREILETLAPGGRFIIGPVHSETTIPAAKLRVLVDAAHAHGSYA